MILIGLGGNLPSQEHGPPRATLAAALQALEAKGARTLRRSPWYESAPVPPSGQPWYVNAVAEVESALSPEALLAALLAVEAELGRVRGARNASRTVDLDLLDYGGLVTGPGEKPELPHPRLHERAFVLLPLRDLAPGWRHPACGRPVDALIEALGGTGPIRRLP